MTAPCDPSPSLCTVAPPRAVLCSTVRYLHFRQNIQRHARCTHGGRSRVDTHEDRARQASLCWLCGPVRLPRRPSMGETRVDCDSLALTKVRLEPGHWCHEVPYLVTLPLQQTRLQTPFACFLAQCSSRARAPNAAGMRKQIRLHGTDVLSMRACARWPPLHKGASRIVHDRSALTATSRTIATSTATHSTLPARAAQLSAAAKSGTEPTAFAASPTVASTTAAKASASYYTA